MQVDHPFQRSGPRILVEFFLRLPPALQSWQLHRADGRIPGQVRQRACIGVAHFGGLARKYEPAARLEHPDNLT